VKFLEGVGLATKGQSIRFNDMAKTLNY